MPSSTVESAARFYTLHIKNMSILEMRSVVDILKILYRGIMVGLVNGGFFTNEAKVIFGGFVGV